ncbi:replicative DNA helicase [Hydrogenoanaerobacterium saccharovorans]|uniref:Replicative DNA helicase n=1 Tax=Hydrogenoanaerobacterium saccharovorans TaxID=474960 RepID=A0A1H8ARI3_9FIRM|nr:replicative DNA helicase [Hydrogenoanaerobacterium saccharovorans]RPF47787.1 replicative DNA helicase [Hydrogenoanaerobacterium saccharovorans]SEM73330.1 replicative DNA helicase [Hydrogenoanaerobacterium saccharovorans]
MADFDNIFDTQMPFNLEAEQSVLGAVLVDSSCIARVLEYIKPECFYKQQHVEIFGILMRMFTSGQPIDIITVLEQVKSEEVFPSEQDAKIYLTQLVQIVPSTANVESYAQIVQEKYYVRCLMTAARDIIENSRDVSYDAKTLLDTAEQRIFEIRKGRETRGLQRINEIIIDTYDHLQKLSGTDKSQHLGTPSGFTQLDNLITGLNKSDLILLAARPAMGKTSFALNIATNVAKKSKTVAVFSLEMSKEQLVQRILSSEAKVQSHLLRTGNLATDDWTRLAEAAEILSKVPLYIDDSSGITVAEMKARLRRMKDLGLVVIDYLQLMSSGRRIDNRVQEVSEITRGLKILAKDLNVPVITLSQLSRGPEMRGLDARRPVLSDLRESGSIEQDADLVLFLYRDEYYNKDTEDKNIAECIIAKNRHGETDSVKLAWDGQYTLFSNLELYRDEG